MISLVIPTYTLTPDLEQTALAAAYSYRPQVDQLIISEDGGHYSDALRSVADTYLYHRENKGFTKNVNRGWRMAEEEYVMIVNSDTVLRDGLLRELCIPGKVTSPEIVNQHIPYLAGPFWCAPKEVTDERGYLVESMRTYCSDSEYDERVRDIFQKVPSVQIVHQMMQTVTEAGVEGGEEQERDRRAYDSYKRNQTNG